MEDAREDIGRGRSSVNKHTQEAQDRFSEDLEVAIEGWKRDMNVEIAKAKDVTKALEEEKRRACFALEQTSLFTSSHQNISQYHSQLTDDMNDHIMKVHKNLFDFHLST